MKMLIALILLLPAFAMADSSSCWSEDGKVSLDAFAGGGQVKSYEIYDDLFFENIGETLPAGSYKNNQDINELLNFHFQEAAWMVLEDAGEADRALFTVYGQNDSSPIVVVYSAKLHCYGDAF